MFARTAGMLLFYKKTSELWTCDVSHVCRVIGLSLCGHVCCVSGMSEHVCLDDGHAYFFISITVSVCFLKGSVFVCVCVCLTV